MEKITILNGSPRQRGNTADLSELLMAELSAAGSEAARHRLYDLNIKPCTDCRACKKHELACTVRDDMRRVYEDIEGADVMVFATPIYWYGPTGQMKLVIDRLRPYYASKKLRGKNAALILSAGSGAGDCDLTIEMFRRVFNTLGINYTGQVIAEAYDIGEAVKNTVNSEEIKRLAEKILSDVI